LGKRLAPRTWGLGSDLATAAIAQTVAGIAFCPIDIVKQRVQAGGVVGSFVTITPLQAAKDLYARQGLRGFFRGYGAMNALWLPWNMIYLTLYEGAKRRVYLWQLERTEGEVEVSPHLPMQQALPVWAFPICSSSCAMIAAVATHPIDVVKTRLQVLTGNDLKGSRSGVRAVATMLYREEGLTGFTRGMAARVGTISVGSSISWFVYEMVKRTLAARAGEG
jgi:hypothetical protein